MLTDPPFSSNPTRIISFFFQYAFASTTPTSSFTLTSVSDMEPATGLINAKSLTFNPKFGKVLKNVNSTEPISDLQEIYFAACLRTIGVILSGVKTIQITTLIATTRTPSNERRETKKIFMNFFMEYSIQ